MTKIHLIRLLLAFGEGDPVINELLGRFGSPEEAYKAVLSNTAAVGNVGEKAASVSFDDAERLLEELYKKGITVIGMNDRLYPSALKGIDNPPCLLFVKGDPAVLSRRLITVVGSRAITDDTYRIQKNALNELMRDFTFVTTMSPGCDTLTALTAVKSNKPCVIVMPSGHDKLYPKDAAVLREEILESGGCLITEYLPQRAASQGSFIRRGRILGGISRAALITQAGLGSGTLLTAENSPAPFFLPPPDIFDKSYAGTVGAVRAGGRLYLGKDDIYDVMTGRVTPRRLMQPLFRTGIRRRAAKKESSAESEAQSKKSENLPEKSAEKLPPKLPEKLPAEGFETEEHYSAYSAIYESGGTLSFDEIMYKTGTALDRLCELLLDLEIEGRITVTAGSRYSVT